ncbi:AAA domain-containing protein [Burkholderia contaminans]|uniref:DEAD/DEAH box helicase n=1 Tax=Burkholderia contaminans TaxID=488447 RepID=UPI00310D1940
MENQGKYTVALTAREDQERDKLSAALGLKETAVRMQEAFATDQWQSEEAWKLTDIGVLGEKETGTHEWSFLEVVEKAGEPVSYLFEGNSPMEVGDELFLRRSNYVGTDRLLNRRVKALLALREHAELLDSLEDPRGVVRPTHETPEEDEQFKLLDESKQAALLDIWEVMPLYLLQGPPGVGKTRLVRELVRRKIAEDPSARLLLSAQSHDAVDHLLQEIGKEFDAGGDDLLIVRSRPRDDKRPPGKYDLHTQAAGLLSRVSKGRLFAELPPHIRSKLDDLDPDQLATTADESDQTTLRRADRSIEALLLRAANLVFASTNARDLERLIEERSQFDWSIVEEAGKATGPELLAPLLLSHRRLMIGDHKQLPPFGADRLQSLLGNPEAIRRALEVGTSLVGWVFREAGLDEIIDDSNAIDDFTAACGDAAAALVMFETLIEQCLPKKENSKRRRDVAKQLSFQHRMHPAIAKLVSTTFYDGELHTHEGTLDRYTNETPPFSVDINDIAVRSPIVFVDMPFVQSTIGKQEIEKKPRYYNDEEIETVIDILSNLRANSDREKPSVAVLAPYVEQVKRLRNRYFEERKSRLHGLSSFSFEGGADTPVGTVDSFQGNEADVVIVSLVRNNARSGKKGLGFLADPRRMNVLLSRAKWKLFIVGSREFLSTRFDGKTDGDLEFLRRMLGSLQAQTKTASINGVVDVSFVTPLIFGKEKK